MQDLRPPMEAILIDAGALHASDQQGAPFFLSPFLRPMSKDVLIGLSPLPRTEGSSVGRVERKEMWVDWRGLSRLLLY